MPRSNFSEAYCRSVSILLDLRKERGLTQVSLAKRLSRPQSFVAKFENYERRLDIGEFFTICAAIGVTRDEALARLRAALPLHLEV